MMKLPPSPVLIISHNIFLTREERYALVGGDVIEVVGISLPVWFSSEHTSKPAEEIFCKYEIQNNLKEKPGTIKCMGGGYSINLPQIPKDWKPAPNISNEEWRKMSEKELSSWYKHYSEPKNAMNLKDINDGGSEYLKFKYLGEFKDRGKKIHLMNYCIIKTINVLQDSILR